MDAHYLVCNTYDLSIVIDLALFAVKEHLNVKELSK